MKRIERTLKEIAKDLGGKMEQVEDGIFHITQPEMDPKKYGEIVAYATAQRIFKEMPRYVLIHSPGFVEWRKDWEIDNE